MNWMSDNKKFINKYKQQRMMNKDQGNCLQIDNSYRMNAKLLRADKVSDNNLMNNPNLRMSNLDFESSVHHRSSKVNKIREENFNHIIEEANENDNEIENELKCKNENEYIKDSSDKMQYINEDICILDVNKNNRKLLDNQLHEIVDYNTVKTNENIYNNNANKKKELENNFKLINKDINDNNVSKIENKNSNDLRSKNEINDNIRKNVIHSLRLLLNKENILKFYDDEILFN